jgi:hypothetical protein
MKAIARTGTAIGRPILREIAIRNSSGEAFTKINASAQVTGDMLDIRHAALDLF